MDILSVIGEEVKEILSDVVDVESVSLETLESEILRVSRELGRRALEACLSHRADVVEVCDEEKSCDVCGGSLRRCQKRRRYVETLCGVVRVSRWEYRCDNGRSYIPWDVNEGVEEGYTKGVAETMCRLSARLDYREAALELKHHGIRVSHTTLQKKVQRWVCGKSVSDSVSPQSLAEGSRWYVSCDGVHTNSPEGWKEVKVGCLYTDRATEQSPGVLCAAEPSSLRYVASASDAETFGKAWFALATASGIYQDETDTEEVVVIGDGAAWIWNLSEEYFPGAVEIIDYMHAKEHLYSVAKQVYGEGETARDRVESWVKVTETFLYAGDIQEVVARIQGLGIGIPEFSEILRKAANYFLKHAKRMRYKYFQENGYHIGSGVIESACKHVVAERCKQAAMKWTREGINAILFWRCLLKNGTWEAFWKPEGFQKAA
ncbi:MAG: ISKra4 family transposase [Candidatus Poribacteria bacterium]|nr:ISKra4 family transposase [Candidatus Poribacteria bacterium]